MAEQMSLSDTVATESGAPGRVCRGCGDPYTPQGSQRGLERLYCSDGCRSRAYDRTHPRVPVQNPDKMTRRDKVLERLRLGPATGLELLQAGGGMRFGARIHELRGRGCRIETDTSSGEWPVYRLEAEDA